MPSNSLTLVGNLTADPETRFTKSGIASCSFTLAVSKRTLNKQTNEWDEKTSFVKVITWRTLAENCGDSLHKGDRVIATGELEQRSWEDRDGQNHSVMEMQADEAAPSLRWSTASILRNERGSTATNATERRPRARSGGAPNPDAQRDANRQYAGGEPVYADDEEPF
jgi:single-strand DNA-binding protein